MANIKEKITVFKLLLVNTLITTIALSFLFIFTLQRISSEHPRQYISGTLFKQLIDNKTHEELKNIRINGEPLTIIPVNEVDKNSPFYEDLILPLNDNSKYLQGSSYTHIWYINDKFYASTKTDDYYIILPPFGEPLSPYAKKLFLFTAFAALSILLFNIFILRKITSPIMLLSTFMKKVSKDSKFTVPAEKSYGEYLVVTKAFNDMLASLNKMHESRKHMLLAIAHELKSPLARLKVRKDLITDEKLRTGILGDIENIEKILDTILITEKRNVESDDINLREFIENLLEDYKNKVDISFDYIAKEAYFNFSPVLLTVLLRNFIDNAVFYGENKPVKVKASLNEGHLHVEVSDNGKGIDENLIQYLTEPFWREDPSRTRASGGYGLGLYICKSIIEKYNGKLSIDSKKGIGTTVHMDLWSNNNENIND